MPTDRSNISVEKIGFVSRSQHRTICLQELYKQGPAAPSQIVEETSLSLSDVSRALSQLREENLVMLLVPDDQSQNRLHDLTQEGVEIVDLIFTVDQVESYTSVSESEFSYQGLLTFLQDSIGESLHGLICFHGRDLEICHPNGKLRQRFEEDEEYRQSILVASSMVWERVQERIDIVGEKRFQLYGFDDVFVLVLVPETEQCVVVTMDAQTDLVVPSFPERCLRLVNPMVEYESEKTVE